MIKNINNVITVLMVITMVVLFPSSCTDQNEIAILSEQTFGITAAHIFDSFTPYEDGDFNLQKEGWTLNIEVLFYDKNGHLVSKESFKSNRIEENFKSTVVLAHAEYTVVAIAHFTKENQNYRYWSISNEEYLDDLSIDETADVLPTAFETFGIHVEKIVTSDSPLKLNIDIKPTTALFDVYEVDKMLSYIGYKGTYSMKCLKVTQCDIRTVGYQNNVRFKDGQPSFNMSELTSNYEFANSRPYDKVENYEAPNSHSYRALLPEGGKQFSWTLHNGEFDSSWEDYIRKLLGSYPMEGRSDAKDIISGHQYSLAFMLDACEFVYEDITGTKYDVDHAVSEAFNKYQISKINKMVNFGFEHMIGVPAKEIEHFTGVNIEDIQQSNTGNYIAYFYHSPETVFEQFISALFKDPACDNAKRILLTLSLPKSKYGSELGQEMPESVFQEIWDALNAKYHHFRTVGRTTMFLDGPTKEESKAGIILDGTELDNVCLYFDDVKMYMDGGDDDNSDDKEESAVIKKVFPYEWQLFLRQDIDNVLNILGDKYNKQANGWIFYNNLNNLVSSVCIVPNTDNTVKSISVMLINHGSEEDALITDYLKEHFYPTQIANMYIDTPDSKSRTMSVIFNGGVINYNVYP